MTNLLLSIVLISLPPQMPAEDIRPGQKGECLTVFEGSTIEPFSFVVKGRMKNYLGPNRDLIMIRLLGKKPEFTGVVSGMSGSPCSIDGKLIGALGYAFAKFAKEPIAGVTPIKDMLAVTELPDEKRPWRLPGDLDDPISWKSFSEGDLPQGSLRTSNERMDPIALPLTVSGISPELFKEFSPWLRKMGYEPVAGGAGGADSVEVSSERPFEPGSPITGVLVHGDITMVSTGTVTTVADKTITAFGHPFMGIGATSIPMGTATILNTMATMSRSFKMSTAGPIVGELVQDRLPAIVGKVGQFPKMISVVGKVTTPAATDSISFKVARDLGRSPYFVAMAVASSLSRRLDVGHRGTLRYNATIHIEGTEPIRLRNLFNGERNARLGLGPAIEIGRAIASIWQTPFAAPPDVRVEFEAAYSSEPIQEVVESIFIDRPQASPGDAVQIAVKLNKIGGESSVERFLITVPHSWAGQTIDFAATDASVANAIFGGIGGQPRPESLKQIVKFMSKRRVGGYLYLMGVRNGVGMRSEVDVLSFLPPSVVALHSGDETKQRRWRGVAWEEKKERPGTIAGIATTALRVLRY